MLDLVTVRTVCCVIKKRMVLVVLVQLVRPSHNSLSSTYWLEQEH